MVFCLSTRFQRYFYGFGCIYQDYRYNPHTLAYRSGINTPRVTEGAFGHLLNRALANIALPVFWAFVYSGVTLGPIDTRVVTRNTNVEDFVTRN